MKSYPCFIYFYVFHLLYGELIIWLAASSLQSYFLKRSSRGRTKTLISPQWFSWGCVTSCLFDAQKRMPEPESRIMTVLTPSVQWTEDFLLYTLFQSFCWNDVNKWVWHFVTQANTHLHKHDVGNERKKKLICIYLNLHLLSMSPVVLKLKVDEARLQWRMHNRKPKEVDAVEKTSADWTDHELHI